MSPVLFLFQKGINMSTLLKPLQVRNEMLIRNLRVFTINEFVRLFGSKPHTTKHFLETHAHEGLLIRLKKGVYALKTDLPREEEVANVLYQPSYISL